jgi:hypothetical protein
LLEILNDLWQQYAERARPLLEHPPGGVPLENPIDESIRWQIQHDPTFAPKATGQATLATLQLPELCSGEATAPLVFVTINPSYDGREVFPTIAHLAEHGAEGIEWWFERRFVPKWGDVPLRHGRRPVRGKFPNPPTYWIRAQDHRGLPIIKGRTQTSTWGRLDSATRLCFDVLTPEQQEAPLGRAARLFDLVPWKFAKWGEVKPHRQPPERKQQFLAEGAHWLRLGLDEHQPVVIIACGGDVRRKMREMDGTASEVPVYAPGGPQCGWFRINTPLGPKRVRWFGVAHPAARQVSDPLEQRHVYPFERDIRALAPCVRAALVGAPHAGCSRCVGVRPVPAIGDRQVSGNSVRPFGSAESPSPLWRKG